MATITKKDLIERIAEQHKCKRVLIKSVIQTFLDTIVHELAQGNRLEFREFGVFESKVRGSRQAQNPKTMDKVPVPPRRTVKFKVGRGMRDELRKAPVDFDEATGLAVEASNNRSRTTKTHDGDGSPGPRGG
jgi:integration host factor subunit beta